MCIYIYINIYICIPCGRLRRGRIPRSYFTRLGVLGVVINLINLNLTPIPPPPPIPTSHSVFVRYQGTCFNLPDTRVD